MLVAAWNRPPGSACDGGAATGSGFGGHFGLVCLGDILLDRMCPGQDLIRPHAAFFQQGFCQTQQVCPLRSQDVAGSPLCSVEASADAGLQFIVGQQQGFGGRHPERP